jgi:hypothetical protein
LWIEQKRGDLLARGREATVLDVNGSAGVVVIDPALPALGEGEPFTLGNIVIRGNVVAAGHGESQNERILGSGDASALNQSFVLAVAGVSFVADPTMPAGVRADIDVIVDGQIWQPAASLKDSAPGDPHYAVRMTEEGFLRIELGDGEHGRRLPTGANNVRVRLRLGTGLAGNLPAGRLEKPAATWKAPARSSGRRRRACSRWNARCRQTTMRISPPRMPRCGAPARSRCRARCGGRASK